MEDVPDFSDRDAVEAWLRGQPREVAITLAARAALRLLPVLIATQENPEKLDDRFQNYFKYALWATTRNGLPDLSYLNLLQSIDIDFYSPSDFFENTDFYSGPELLELMATATHSELSDLLSGKNARDVLEVPLWYRHPGKIPARREAQWSRLRAHLLDANEHWDFWIDWYERHLHGRPHDWDLLERIALIPDEHWQRGPAHVNSLIAQMVRLEGSNPKAAARDSITKALATLDRHGIGGNDPPEPITDGPTREEFEALKAALETLQRELAKNSEPDRETIERNAEVVRGFWLKVWDWWMANPEVFAEESLRASGKALPYFIGGIGGALITVVAALFRLIPFL